MLEQTTFATFVADAIRYLPGQTGATLLQTTFVDQVAGIALNRPLEQSGSVTLQSTSVDGVASWTRYDDIWQNCIVLEHSRFDVSVGAVLMYCIALQTVVGLQTRLDNDVGTVVW
jgi:hypothetical protein